MSTSAGPSNEENSGPQPERALPEPPRSRWRRLPHRRMRRNIGRLPVFAIGLLLGALVALAVQVFVMDESEPPPEASVFTPAVQPRDPDVVVTLSYELIAALIQQEVDRGAVGVPLREIRADESNGRLRLTAKLTVLRQTVNGSVELEPQIVDGQLRTRLHRARFGRLPFPQNLERLAEGPLNRQLDLLLSDLPATLLSARVTEDGLLVTADVRVEDLPFLQR